MRRQQGRASHARMIVSPHRGGRVSRSGLLSGLRRRAAEHPQDGRSGNSLASSAGGWRVPWGSCRPSAFGRSREGDAPRLGVFALRQAGASAMSSRAATPRPSPAQKKIPEGMPRRKGSLGGEPARLSLRQEPDRYAGLRQGLGTPRGGLRRGMEKGAKLGRKGREREEGSSRARGRAHARAYGGKGLRGGGDGRCASRRSSILGV